MRFDWIPLGVPKPGESIYLDVRPQDMLLVPGLHLAAGEYVVQRVTTETGQGGRRSFLVTVLDKPPPSGIQGRIRMNPDERGFLPEDPCEFNPDRLAYRMKGDGTFHVRADDPIAEEPGFSQKDIDDARATLREWCEELERHND